MLNVICKRDGHPLERTGETDKLDGGERIERRRCPKCGYSEWVRPHLAWEVCDQRRFSGIRGERVA